MTVTTLYDPKVREAQNRTTVPVNHYWAMPALKGLVVLADALDMFRLTLLGRGSSHLANGPLEEQISAGWISGCWTQKVFGRISWRILRRTWSNSRWKPPQLPETCPVLFQLILALALQATSVRVAQYTKSRVYLPATPAASGAVRQPTSPRWAQAAAKLTN